MLLHILCFLGLATFFVEACPTGTVPTFGNKSMCYFWLKLNPTVPTATFLGSEIACQEKGGHLASIHNKIESMYLREHMKVDIEDHQKYWIGINDLDKTDDWTWEDQSAINYTNWEIGQPTNRTDFDCGIFSITSGKWAARDCTEYKCYICLIPASTRTTTTTPFGI